MHRNFQSVLVTVAIAITSADSSTCEASSEEGCLSGVGKVASDSGSYSQDMVLMQLRTRTSMPKVTWSESDPVLDEDFPEDDQPGGQDLTRPAPAKPGNVTPVQVAHVQASVDVHQAPEKEAAKSEGSDPTPAPDDGNATAKSDDSSAAPAVDTSEEDAQNDTATNDNSKSENTSDGNSTNLSANATTGEESKANATGACVTREDDRIESWFASPAAPGTPCVFGVDVRDENSHCIFENGAYGSNGWCYTNSDRSEWGACNEHCPLYGSPASLGRKIDSVAKKLDKVVEKLVPGNTSNATTEAPSMDDSAKKEDDISDAKGKGKGKGKGDGNSAADGDSAKGKGKGKGF